MGIQVRYEPFPPEAAGSGGLCRLRDRSLIIVDAHAPLEGRIQVLARALSRVDLSEVYVLPALRELLEQAATDGMPPGDSPDRRRK